MFMVICVKNLRVSSILGVYEEERRTERDIIINVRVEYDASAALKTDALEDALDYKQIRDRIVNFVTGTQFKLLEKLADGILQVLAGDGRITGIHLEVDKPHALRLAESVSAIMEWKRTGRKKKGGLALLYRASPPVARLLRRGRAPAFGVGFANHLGIRNGADHRADLVLAVALHGGLLRSAVVSPQTRVSSSPISMSGSTMPSDSMLRSL